MILPSVDTQNAPPYHSVRRTRSWQNIDSTDSTPFGFAPDLLATSEMPRNLRQDVTPSRLQGREQGRKLSCKECRRLKLKSCRKRGCGDICPDGALTSGRGSRFILANTEQLHQRNDLLTERVRQLEEALRSLQATCSSDPHPLLSPELLQLKITQDYYSVPQSISSVLSQSTSDGLRESVNALSLIQSEPSNLPIVGEVYIEVFLAANSEYSSNRQLDVIREEIGPPVVPPDVLQLSATFPFPWAVDLRIRALIRGSLPPREEAEAVCDEARGNALWQYNLDPSETFLRNLIHHCYASPIDELSPRRLALLLMVLSIGSLVDLNKPLGNLYGEAYHHLARASVCEIPLMEEPDFDTLHALFFMIWYHLIFSDNKKAVGYAWNLMGFVAKLAQGLGLHREGGRLKLIPEEHEKRRCIFWELLNLDCRMSLSLGRPPSICLSHIDIKPPTYQTQGIFVPREEILYHEWKNSFFITCLSPILEAIIAPQAPDYSVFLALDSKVRDFMVPEILDERNVNNGGNHRFLVMQRALVSTGRHIALLQLHRRHFMEAMNSPDFFDLSHQFAPSVLATYLSASSMIAAVETLFEQEEQLSGRFLCFWFNAFSASVSLSLLASRAPTCALAPCILSDLERVCCLFVRAAKILPFSAKTLPVIQKMAEKARRVFQEKGPQPHMDAMLTRPAQTLLPCPSFLAAHVSLQQYLARLQHALPMTSASVIPTQAYTFQDPSRSYLPDIYHFNSAGIGIEERYRIQTPFASAPPTPFMPSSPRVDPDEDFHFDHGALATDLEETSFMACDYIMSELFLAYTFVLSAACAMQAQGSQPRIREVWAPNLQEEMRLLRDIIETHPYIAMDTEFPGVVARPIGNFKTSSDYHYQTMRCNVDLLKIIQVGITLSDEEGSYSPEGATWQFNFRFSVDDDMYAPESINLLRDSGLDFQRHTEYGISPNDFAELMITSGMVLTKEIKWLSYHSGYDFGYFLKLLTNESLPVSEDTFFDLLKIWFPTIYDIKYMLRIRNVVKGGLKDIAEELGVQRVGTSHQAGSDSLLTSSVFFKLCQRYFPDGFSHEDCNQKLFGLGHNFTTPTGMDAGRSGITGAEREDRSGVREVRSQTPAPQTQAVTMGMPLTPGIPSQISATTYGPMGANGPPYLRTSLVGNR
ncbi:hypothetical protein D9758_014459 [Tetrapyrgos nigripes]|uniref:poly(A)-specific ribonuclease n=1 Tax=Tetrapyrgos nigripes TaxID=182062 RepID=A0A8H5FB91_9AGAR|nr:hypothetical protein D9758_014459 [Tetrapyrgos nigripes]